MAITFEKTPLEWQNPGTEPSTALKANGFSAGYKPAASTFNYQINNTSECLTELQTKLSDLDGDAIKGVKGNGTTINPSSTGIVNITPNNIGAATSTHYHNASQITSGTLPIERGGTGATTAEEARTNLGVASSDLSNVDNTVFATKATSAGVAGNKWTTLYSNSTKQTGTITLYDSISNYVRVKICYTYSTSNDNYVERVFKRGSNRYTLDYITFIGEPYIYGLICKISGTTLTMSANNWCRVYISNSAVQMQITTDTTNLGVLAVYGSKTYE